MGNNFLFRKACIVITIVNVLLCGAVQAAALDQKSIHSYYNEGDFSRVVTDIKSFMKSNSEYSRSDSVFIAKHLAVVYSASPETRELGKYYMHLLLRLMPSAELLDMYVSEEIDRIFEKIRKEFLVRQESFDVDSTRYLVPKKEVKETETQSAEVPVQPSAEASSAAASQGAETKDTQSGSKPKPRNNMRKYWIGGGVAVVALGVTAFFLLSGGEEEPPKVYNVPRD